MAARKRSTKPSQNTDTSTTTTEEPAGWKLAETHGALAFRDLDTIVAVAASGERVVTITHGKTLRAWDGVTGQPRFTLRRASTSVASLALSPDGTRACWGVHGDGVLIADLVAGKSLGTLSIPGVRSLAVSPDGTTLLVGGDRKQLFFRGEKGWELRSASSGVVARALPQPGVTPEVQIDGQRRLIEAVSGWGTPGMIRVRALDGGAIEQEITLQDPEDEPSCLALSEDEQTLAVGSCRGLVYRFAMAAAG